MRKKLRLPFTNMKPKGWQNLALAAALTFYIIQIGFFAINGTICEDYAFDYCAYWSAGKLMNQAGFTDAYDLDLLAQFQKDTYNIEDKLLEFFKPIEVPYLPIFLIPFKVVASINLPASFLLWTLVNFVGLILYLKFFIEKVSEKPLHLRHFTMLLLSLPVFISFQEGQVNVWLLICAGEFIRAILSNKHIKAGLWLGGWLLKPQILLLILPFLLLKRSIKSLLGFSLSTLVILLVSFLLIKWEGLIKLFNIIFESAGGGATSNPGAMMNWRMLGWHLTSITSDAIGWIIIIIGSILTIFATFYFFRKGFASGSSIKIIEILGVFAATMLVTWHAHVHMSIVLIPPMVYLLEKNRFNKSLFSSWVFFPIFFHLIGYIVISVIFFGNVKIEILSLSWFIRGFPSFLFNLILLIWTIKHTDKEENETQKNNTWSNDTSKNKI